MEMKGEYTLPVPRPLVWAALNDVEVLKAAIPGCDSIARLSDTEIEATVTAKVGPVKASFKGLVTLSDLDPPNGYTISGEGKGGAAGFARGGAKVRLADAPGGGTLLSYEVDASVGGKLAQIGGRLIDSTAKKLADEFFARFAELAANKVDMSPGTAADVTRLPVSDTVTASQTQEEASQMTQSHTAPPRDSSHPVPPSKAHFDRWLIFVCAVAILAGIYGAIFVK